MYSLIQLWMYWCVINSLIFTFLQLSIFYVIFYNIIYSPFNYSVHFKLYQTV